MKRIIFLFVLAISITAYGQNMGIGIRLGDPTGLTLKKHIGKNALEFSFGRSHLFSNHHWYNDNFDSWYLHQNFGYTDFQYQDYKASIPLGMQLHYLINKDIYKIGSEDIKGLQWYFGFGGQFRFRNYHYTYTYKVPGDPNWHYGTSRRVTDIDLGVDGVIGLEYKFDKVPFSVFIDMTIFMEVVDNPFLPSVQGGIGGRYNF